MSTTAVFQVDGAAAAAAGTIDEDAITTAVIDMIEHELQQQPSSPAAAKLKLARSLWGVSSLTLVADVSAMLYQPPKGPVFANHGAAYYAILAAVLAVVALQMATAYCLQQSSCRGQAEAEAEAHGRRVALLAFAKGLLLFAGLLLLFVLAVGGFALTAAKAP